MPSFRLVHGDALAELAALPADSVDALVTDPPAGISFMGKAWDGDKGGRDEWIAAFAEVFREALRVLKPGAHGVVWALPRTAHWTATALENAGFEIRDVIVHLFGTGFPKSLNLGDGRGTALKPGAEHWILIRKPLAGTVAQNVKRYGTGALNIDACRIASPDLPEDRHRNGGTLPPSSEFGDRFDTETYCSKHPLPPGRWPANVTLDGAAAAALDEQSGERRSALTGRADPAAPHPHPSAAQSVAWLGTRRNARGAAVYADSGGASRFFYVAKPSRAERDAGCDALPAKSGGEATGRADGSKGLRSPRAGAGRGGGGKNSHPTVKPVALMQWLIRLVTPEGGTVLDPFTGSGTTGVAALPAGYGFLGIERDGGYLAIAQARLSHAAGRVDSP